MTLSLVSAFTNSRSDTVPELLRSKYLKALETTTNELLLALDRRRTRDLNSASNLKLGIECLERGPTKTCIGGALTY